MKNNLLIKFGIMALLLAGLNSCELKPDEGPDENVKIENLRTRLRIIEVPNIQEGYAIETAHIWHADPEGVIIHNPYANPHSGTYKGDTSFGYTDADGELLICEVTNFPESAKQWEGEDFTTMLGTITEVNIQMDGTIRIYTDDKGEKRGTLEITSLEPFKTEGEEPVLQMGTYMETFPNKGCTKIDFIDGEKMRITYEYCTSETFSYLYEYEIRERGISLTNTDITESGFGLFFRVLNDSTFELDYLGALLGDGRRIIMTFEKE